MPVSSSTEHWIKPDALTINLNHFGDPDYLQVSVLAGAVVMAFKQDVIGYNAAHNYRTWPLEAANTYLETSSAVNVYAKLTRSEVNARALIAYDTALRDIEGREITYAQDGSEILGEPNPDLYYVFLGQISESIDSSGQSKQREWTIDFKFGNLDTNQYQNEEAGGEWTKMFRLNKVTDMIDVLKTFSSVIFKKLFIDKKAVTDVAVKSEVDEASKVSDTVLASTAWVTATVDHRFLRKDQDDRTEHSLGVGGDLEVGGSLDVDGHSTVEGDLTVIGNLASDNFVQGNTMGSGWSVYRDANGNFVVETDRMIVRKDMFVNELVVNQETYNKGSIIYVKAGCTITRVEEEEGFYRCYYDNENGNSYSGFKVGDQARCQRYDKSYEGLVKYYWRLVVGVRDDYVDLSKTDKDGSGVPEEGDDIAQLGNRTDKTRQSAIVISPDNGGSVVVWAGIDSFELSNRNMVGMGVNHETGRAYLYGYGDLTFGNRNGSSYMKYTPEDGLEVRGSISVGSKLPDGRDVDDFVGNVDRMDEDLSSVKEMTDRDYTIWFYEHIPTLENEPAVNWSDDEKVLHEQDMFYNRDAGKAWRFEGGAWVEITDQDTIRALEQIAATNKKVSNMEYLSNALGNFSTTIEGGLVMTSLVAVQNAEGQVEAFLNGSDFAESEEHGKLLLAGGIAEGSGDTLEDRAKEAITRIYEDGCIYTNQIIAKGGEIGGWSIGENKLYGSGFVEGLDWFGFASELSVDKLHFTGFQGGFETNFGFGNTLINGKQYTSGYQILNRGGDPSGLVKGMCALHAQLGDYDYGLHITGGSTHILSSGITKLNGLCLSSKVITETYTVTENDDILIFDNTSAITIKFPTNNFAGGKVLFLKRVNTGAVTFSGNFRQANQTSSGEGQMSINQDSYIAVKAGGDAWTLFFCG